MSGCTDPETPDNIYDETGNTKNIKEFWDWFSSHENTFRDFNNASASLNEILLHSKTISDGLAFEIEPIKNGVINMTVSADGDSNLFPIVQEIVAKAPHLKEWHVFAFRQRISAEQLKDMLIDAKGIKLDPNKMMFYPIVSNDTIDIIIYTEHLNEQNKNEIAYAGLMLIDNILGEYDCVNKVRAYDFQLMPSDTNELKDLKPLLDIATYVDEFHRKKAN
jgi:hypothetical protein